jgi:putative membrane protein
MTVEALKSFWTEAFTFRGAATLRVLPSVIAFGALACLISLLSMAWGNFGIEIGPHEVAGALLGLILVLRTNAGYDRWWEARKLWGGIVNQSRNLALAARAYGPNDPAWSEQVVRWTIAFSHTARASLRGERDVPELNALLGPGRSADVLAARHMPSYVMNRIAELLEKSRRRGELDGFAFLQIDKERAALIDHIGACERILKTPLAHVYAIKVRRFIVLFLATLPFALLHKFENGLLVPLVTMLVAYPVLALDQIGVELQNPFSVRSLSHLPLGDIVRTIEQDLLAMLQAPRESVPASDGTQLPGVNGEAGIPLRSRVWAEHEHRPGHGGAAAGRGEHAKHHHDGEPDAGRHRDHGPFLANGALAPLQAHAQHHSPRRSPDARHRDD